MVFFGLAAAMPGHAGSLLSGQIASIDAPRLNSKTEFAPEYRITQSDGLSLSQAVEQVRRKHKGRIVSAETRRSGNREVHHIKVLTDSGKVITEKVQGRRLDPKG
jgi:hypothetical protein